MALVSDRTTWRKVEHPTESGVWFQLRPLTDDEYQQALDKRFDQTIEKARNMGADLFQSIRAGEEAAKREDTMTNIHPATAIQFALKEWSYSEPCEDENKALLDRETQDFLKGIIVEMNAPRPLATSPSSNGSSNKDELSLSSTEHGDSSQAESL